MKTVILFVFILMNTQVFSQQKNHPKIIFSGVVVEGDSLQGLAGTSVRIAHTDSITDYKFLFSVLSDKKGFFMLEVKPNDVIEFKKKGYSDSKYVVPATYKEAKLTIVQTLVPVASEKDSLNLQTSLQRN